MLSHMTPKERNAHFREHYACGGRDMPEPHGRKGAKGSRSKWDKEAKRDATHSKG